MKEKKDEKLDMDMEVKETVKASEGGKVGGGEG